MTIESAVQSHLTTELGADANLSALSVQVYPHVAPQSSTLPFVTYEIQSTDPEYFLNASQSDLDFTIQTLELQIWANTMANRALIMASIKDIMHGVTGAIGIENLDIRQCVIDNVSTFSESEVNGTDEEIYRASLDLRLMYNWS